jgi:hypothetical protein
MKTITFTSRRGPLVGNQLVELTALASPLEATQTIERTIQWEASTDSARDLERNREIWRDLAWKGTIIAGDFPHVALEALQTFDGKKGGYLGQGGTEAVYVRIYTIGGGFKRDTEYLRWARIK